MKKCLLRTVIIICITTVCIIAAFRFSRYRAIQVTDKIMLPMFSQGWHLTNIRVGAYADEPFTYFWTIEYNDKDESMDFGPQFEVTLLGRIRSRPEKFLKHIDASTHPSIHTFQLRPIREDTVLPS
jgi:hypothetical protein